MLNLPWTMRLTMFLLMTPWRLIAMVSLAVGATAYFVSMAAPDITWVNVASDAPDYLLATKFWRIAHPTGEPLYIILGGLWLRVFPFGSEYWRLALLSAIPAAATAVLLYHHSKNLLAPLVFMASGVVVSQSTVAEIYGLTVFLMVLGWHLHQTERKGLAYTAFGLGCAVHHWAALMLLVMVAWDYAQSLRGGDKWQPLRHLALAVVVGAPWYLYVVLANRAPYFSIGGNSLVDYLSYFLSQGGLFGGLSVLIGDANGVRVSPDLLMRIYDFLWVIIGGFGLPALLVFGYGAYQGWKEGGAGRMLAVLSIMFLIHYFWNADPHTHTYTMPAFAFGGLLIARAKLPRWNGMAKAAVIVTALGLMAFNLDFYDIQGRNLDADAAAVDYYQQLQELPQGAVLWTHGRDWEYTTALLHNWQEHGDYLWIDRIQGEKPTRTLADIWPMLQSAEKQGLLYESVMQDASAHTVSIQPAPSAAYVMRSIMDRYGANRIATGGFDVAALEGLE